MLNTTKLSGAIRYALIVGTAAVLATPAFAQEQESEEETQTLDAVEVTGSRIQRADIEGSLPVTVISREQLQASGRVSVADVMRDVTFSSAGNFRPQSGSSAQAGADIDLRGLGSNRTLVLVDGRRAPTAPFTGSNADLNSIPLAAVERIEILTDGASAIYGSDAIGGVVNVILRKDFTGAEYTLGRGDTSIKGGDTEEGSMIVGVAGDRGNLLAGASYNKRGMVFTRDRPWGQTPGNSTFGNNILNPRLSGVAGWTGASFLPLPGGCTETNFSILAANGRCVFDFNRVAADEAKVGLQSAFARGTYEINEDWQAYMTATVSRAESFGRYAPTPGVVLVGADSPNNPTATMPQNPTPGVSVPFYLYHRFAAAGNRDTTTDSNVYDLNFGFQGRILDTVDIDVGVRQSEFKYFELGRNYIVRALAEQAINDGSYNLFRPSLTPATVLSGIKATIGRESQWVTQEIYAMGNMDLFELGGGTSATAFGIEYRTEEYSDLYDSLSEGNQILGSAGNSAGGGRDVLAVYAEALFPFFDGFEMSLAGRYEEYSDYGSDFAPKIAFRYQPLENLTLRAAYGEGFRAPTLDIVTQSRAFSADTVFDPQTCVSFGDFPGTTAGRGGLTPEAWCAANGGVNGVQVNAFRNAASTLDSEQSEQFSLGAVYDPTDWLSLTLDYWNIKITDRQKFFSSQELVDIVNGDDPDPFPGAPCALSRRTDGSIREVNNCWANQGTVDTDGFDFVARTEFDFNDWGSLNNQLTVSKLQGYVVDAGEEQVGLEGLPEYRANLQNIWSIGDFEFVYNVRYIHDNGPIPSQTLNDVQGNWNAPWNGTVSVGVTNIEDEFPFLGSGASFGGRNFNFSLYDAYGRTTYVRYTQRF
jgi:iron complex outermembrane receptor protein